MYMKSFQYKFILLFVLLTSCFVQLSGADEKGQKVSGESGDSFAGWSLFVVY